MTVLVTGATGQVGRNVVEQLAEAGERVRAMTRAPEKARLHHAAEVVRGDLDEPESLTNLLRDVDRMYLFPCPGTAREIVDLAKRSGVRRIVVLSSGSVAAGYDTDYQYPVEQAVEASGLEWTHLRPGEFMSNKLHLWGPSIRAERVVRYTNPDLPANPIHEADIAAVGVAALLQDGHAGQAYLMSGPEVITQREQVRLIGEALGVQVRFEEVTPQEGRRILQSYGGWAAANADFLMGFEGFSADSDGQEFSAEDLAEMMRPLPTVEQVLGRPPRTFAEWARDHVADFR
ncbi:MAG: NAD(P)H-binding protein [Egibacteraceae bacterium]